MSEVVITRGPLNGQKRSKTITDAHTIEKFLTSAAAVPAPTSKRNIKWAEGVEVMTVQLPKPVGVFTDGVVEVWGETTLRVPAQTSFSFFAGSDQAEQLATAVGSLWTSA